MLLPNRQTALLVPFLCDTPAWRESLCFRFPFAQLEGQLRRGALSLQRVWFHLQLTLRTMIDCILVQFPCDTAACCTPLSFDTQSRSWRANFEEVHCPFSACGSTFSRRSGPWAILTRSARRARGSKAGNLSTGTLSKSEMALQCSIIKFDITPQYKPNCKQNVTNSYFKAVCQESQGLKRGQFVNRYMQCRITNNRCLVFCHFVV